ncbi:Hypothetical protein Minf_0173 [Methylacidiphilum infernorum V4]|uniref:Uncharacterized protein n=1 Tax=Methylacidiphilum infernorum (isolate V4) TaxID=481448 RepID=B3DXJ9_METI4|nr:Hypothetical protein Minf_0173 [Methylacidiphilum infernorum V4]
MNSLGERKGKLFQDPLTAIYITCSQKTSIRKFQLDRSCIEENPLNSFEIGPLGTLFLRLS